MSLTLDNSLSRYLPVLFLFTLISVFSSASDSPSAVLPKTAKDPIYIAPAFKNKISGAQHLMLPMRDGVRLWTSIYFPKQSTEKNPTILVRTPYALDYGTEQLLPFLDSGYVIALQNERGRFWSEGEYHILPNAGPDGYDTVDWLSKQPWSNGKIGTFGCSSSGDAQTELAVYDHPAHAAAINAASGSSIGNIGPFNERGLFYRGGAIQMPWLGWYIGWGQRAFPKFPDNISSRNREWLAQEAMKKDLMNPGLQQFSSSEMSRAMATLPLEHVVERFGGQVETDFARFVRRSPGDPAWEDLSLLEQGNKIGVPTLWMFQTHDLGVGPNLAGFEYVINEGATKDAKAHQHMIMSPLGHCNFGMHETSNTINGDRLIGDARYPYQETFLDWFDYWLRGDTSNNIVDLPLAQVYVPGNDSWQSFSTWPPASQTQVPFYLQSGGDANSRLGGGRITNAKPADSGTDSFIYDPSYPVPTVGGDACCIADVGSSKVRPGSFDQGEIELREDILVYTSEALREPVDVVGFAKVTIYVSSNVPDTDFTANLVDVAPDGTAYILAGSIQRARWRNGYDEPELMEPDQVYEVTVGPFFVSNRFQEGHRIRVDIASSNFPRFERNLNTGGKNYNEHKGQVAENTIHFGPDHQSILLLPVVNLAE